MHLKYGLGLTLCLSIDSRYAAPCGVHESLRDAHGVWRHFLKVSHSKEMLNEAKKPAFWLPHHGLSAMVIWGTPKSSLETHYDDSLQFIVYEEVSSLQYFRKPCSTPILHC